MSKNVKKSKIFVAMSGGVDSSVATALLHKQGHAVTGVYFKPWSDMTGLAYCNWQQDRQDAMRVAVRLGIKFETWDFSKEYGKQVTQYMIDSYKSGITPNPDVMCNKEIKFGLFLKKALARGADYIATGHYVRRKEVKDEQIKLLKAKDQNKDQSYFLYNLTQKELKHSLFPLGDYTKPEVRAMAKRFKLANHAKKDSQGVCFVGKLDMKDFLQKYIKPKSGEVRLMNTKKAIGTHDGIYYYTIGQRHGLDLGIAGGPFFVVKKDIKRNIIYVNNKILEENEIQRVNIKNISRVNSLEKLPLIIEVKLRYRTREIPANLIKNVSGNNAVLEFKKPVRDSTPGQSAVFYKGDEILGGGVISS